jgi:hypothetical protein
VIQKQPLRHAPDNTGTCRVCGMLAFTIRSQANPVCDGGAALARKAVDASLVRAVRSGSGAPR